MNETFGGSSSSSSPPEGVHSPSKDGNPLWRAAWESGIVDSYPYITDVYNKHLILQTSAISPDDLLEHIIKFVAQYDSPKLARRLARANRKLFKKSPKHVKHVSGHINVAAIDHSLSTEAKFEDHHTKGGKPYPDDEICNHIAGGFPDRGGLHKSGLFDEIDFIDLDPDAKNPRASINELRRNRVLLEEYHFSGRDVVLRLHEAEEHWQPDQINRKVWENTLKELASGIMVGPFSPKKALEEMDRRGHKNTTVSMLFGVHQPKESDPERCRSVLNMVDINDQSYLSEKFVFPNHAEIPKWIIFSCNQGKKFLLNPKVRRKTIFESVERIRLMKELGPAEVSKKLLDAQVMKDELMNSAARSNTYCELEFILMDFKAAYRQISCKDLSTNWIRVWNPVKRQYQLVLALACQFGSLHSVSSWVRVSELVVHLLRTRLGINAIVYIDDVIMLVPKKHSKKISELVRHLVNDIWGFRLDKDKEFIGQRAKILGVIYEIGQFGGVMSAEECRLNLLKRDIATLRRAFSDPARAADVKWVELARIVGKAIFIANAATSVDLSFWAVNLSSCLPYERIISRKYSKNVPIFHMGDRLLVTESGLPVFAVCDRLDKLVRALCNYKPYRFAAPNHDSNFVFAFTDASAAEEESSLGWMWYATDVYGRKVAQSAKRMVMDDVSKEIFKHDEASIKEGSTFVDIKLTETVTTVLCVEEITKQVENPVVFSSCDNLVTVYSLSGRRVSSFKMLKLVSYYLQCLDTLGISLPICYIPTNLNPADGLTRMSLVTQWRETFEGLNFDLAQPQELNRFGAILREGYHVSLCGRGVKKAISKKSRGSRKKTKSYP
jgi:hypothetical protein